MVRVKYSGAPLDWSNTDNKFNNNISALYSVKKNTLKLVANDRPTDRQTDRQTDMMAYRAAIAAKNCTIAYKKGKS